MFGALRARQEFVRREEYVRREPSASPRRTSPAGPAADHGVERPPGDRRHTRLATAFLITSAVFDLPDLWAQIDELPASVPTTAGDQIVRETRVPGSGGLCLLTRRPRPLFPSVEIERFAPAVRTIQAQLPELLVGREADATRERTDRLRGHGVPTRLAMRTASLLSGIGLLDAVEVAERVAGVPVEDVARMYYTLSERLR